MRLLLCLAERAGEVVSIDDLLKQVWPDVVVSSDSVYQAVASLRRLLGDDPKRPAYIATVPRLGYRMVAAVSRGEDQRDQAAEAEAVTLVAGEALGSGSGSRFRAGFLWSAGGVFCCLLGVAFLAFLFHSRVANSYQAHLAGSVAVAPQPQKSIAVLPFLDLTEGMKEGEFADGMTEELIDKLSKVPGLQVPGATSSFYYRDKELPVADIARALGVAYVLDGSVRKSGERLRVAARLVRADNGYVVWSESYDRPFHDILMVQDDIAGEVTKALKAAAEFKGR